MIFRVFNNRRSEVAVSAFLLSSFFLLPFLHADEDTERPRVTRGPWVRGIAVGPRMNVIDEHLKGSIFVGQDLQRSVFDGCDLDGVVFYQCDLTGASFKGAQLTGMNITDCQIENADFTDAIINGIAGMSGGLTDPPIEVLPHDMHLSEKQLISTRSYKTKDLRRCVISLAGQLLAKPRLDFREANLEGAFRKQADVTNRYRCRVMTTLWIRRKSCHAIE